MDKIRLLLWSDAVAPTGFARVMHSIVENLPKDKYDIVWLGVNYYGDPHEYDVKIYPTGMNGDLYGLSRLEEIVNRFRPDLVFGLNDIWVIKPFFEHLKNICKDQLPKSVFYFPVDAFDHNADWYKGMEEATLVTYTEFGKKVSETASGRDNISIIPHGVDVNKFYKMPGDKISIKKEMYPDRPDYVDSFIVLNANRNQPRKKLDITMEGFTIFAQDKPENVKLYMHCGLTDASMNIGKLAERYGIKKRLILTTLGHGPTNVPISRLNLTYNACDVGINTGLGEGWGLTSIEHGITGAPQIVPAHSACAELFEDCGLLMPINQWYTMDNIMTTGGLVSPHAVAYALEQLYSNKELYDDLSKKTLAKFSRDEYQWSTIAKRWDHLFDEVLTNDNNLAIEHV